MIQPTSPIVIPAQSEQTADGLWITNLQILAPTTTGKIRVIATITPFISSTGALIPSKAKVLRIDDVATLAQTDASIATAMGAIFAAIQTRVQTENLF